MKVVDVRDPKSLVLGFVGENEATRVKFENIPSEYLDGSLYLDFLLPNGMKFVSPSMQGAEFDVPASLLVEKGYGFCDLVYKKENKVIIVCQFETNVKKAINASAVMELNYKDVIQDLQERMESWESSIENAAAAAASASRAEGEADRAQGVADTFSGVTLPAAITAIQAAGQAKVDLAEEQVIIATNKAKDASDSAAAALASEQAARGSEDWAREYAEDAEGIVDTFSNTILPEGIIAIQAAGQAKVDLAEQQAVRAEEAIDAAVAAANIAASMVAEEGRFWEEEVFLTIAVADAIRAMSVEEGQNWEGVSA